MTEQEQGEFNAHVLALLAQILVTLNSLVSRMPFPSAAAGAVFLNMYLCSCGTWVNSGATHACTGHPNLPISTAPLTVTA